MGCDVAIIGGGHNALAAAAYLARAGLRTAVFERRDRVGGACVTEELWPGFRISRAAYVAGLLRPALVRELALERHGLRLLKRSPSSYTPLPDGRGLLMGPDVAATCAEIRRFSPRDAARYPAYERFLDRVARTLEPLLDAPPPNPARLRPRDLRLAARLVAGAWRLGADLTRAAPLLVGPARPALESWFESEPLRGTLATDAVIGAWAPPSAPGTGYVLFHHVMGETHGERGVWAYVEGGMGRLSDALAAAARSAGAEIRVDAPVTRIAVAGGEARGVELADGTAVAARTVVSGADPRHTLLDLVGAAHLDAEVVRELSGLDFRSGSLKINCALDRLPVFRGTAGAAGPHHRGTIHVGATALDDLERCFAEAQGGELPSRPLVELTLPSALDASLAPADRHVASLFVQWVPPARPGAWDAAAWNGAREAFADRVFACVDEVAPGFTESVLHREVLAPPDLERVFGLPGGNLFHGAMTLDRLFFLRPLPGWGYRTPVRGLFLCGAGTHPGGGVMGACGRNAAREILRSRARR